MSNFTMRLLKCPSCGGPMDPASSGESTMKCPYCGNLVVIPESLRKPDPVQKQSQVNLFSGVDMNALTGYGANWAEVMQLAQAGKKEEAIKKYVSFAHVSETDARHTIDALAGAQTYEFAPTTSGFTTVQISPIITEYANTAKSVTRWSMWLGCGITAFIMFIVVVTVLPALIGVFVSLWAAFNSF